MGVLVVVLCSFHLFLAILFILAKPNCSVELATRDGMYFSGNLKSCLFLIMLCVSCVVGEGDM
jgi:hypothetical protein